MTRLVTHQEKATAVDGIEGLLRLALGLGAGEEQLNAAQMALRAVVVYVVTVIIVRLGKKRFMGQGTAFDVILGIILGSIVSRAITGNAPFFAALAAAEDPARCPAALRIVTFSGTPHGAPPRTPHAEAHRKPWLLDLEARRRRPRVPGPR
jgi:hypothetical protein